MIFNEYNLNIINFNKIFEDTVELNISNFIYNYNLTVNEKSKDLRNIINHFLITEILNKLNYDYKNIIIYSNKVNLRYLNFIDSELLNIIILEIFNKSSKKFKFCTFEIDNKDIQNILDDKNIIHKLKHFTNCKKVIDYKKLEEYCNSNKLKDIKEKLNNNKIKLKLAK